MKNYNPGFICLFFTLISHPICAQLDTLRITGSSYFDETRTRVLCDYISKKLRIPVKYENIPATRKMHTQLRQDKVDVALMNTFQYVFAKNDRIEGIEPFIILGDSAGNPKTYRSCLIVRPASKFQDLSQILKNAENTRLDFAYVASTSGHIVPRMQLATLGIPYPEAQFASVHFSGGHLEAIRSVLQKRADAAFVSLDDLINYELTNQVPDSAVKIIWTSEPIIQSPVVIRRSLPASVKQQLRQLFLHLSEEDPAVWRHIRENWGAVDPAGFVVAKPADFGSMQQAADKVGKLVYFLNYYEEQLAQQSQELSKGDQLIEGQKAKISQQNAILDQQILQIKTQTFSLYLLGLVVLGIIAIIVVVVQASRSKQRLNDALLEKNKALEDTLIDLKLTQDKLVHSEKMASLGLLTAGIAHEINNPVNFIFTGINGLEKNVKAMLDVLGAFEELEKSPVGDLDARRVSLAASKQQNRYGAVKESLAEFTSGIRIGAQRTADIVSGLRNFARTDESERTQAHVHNCLDSTLLLLQFKIKQTGVQLVKEYDGQIPEFACYPGPLNQAFMNIFTNALQAIEMRKGQNEGIIVVNTKLTNDIVNITISDNGTGIPKELLTKIFDPFFTTKEVGEGTGLGLSITYGIIRKHQGSIEVKSESGRGTTISIRLPANLTLT